MSAVEVVPFTGGRLTDFVGGDVWLNAEGRRFVSEGETFDVIRSAVEAQPEGRLWVVSDVKSNKGATLPVKLMSGTVASAESLEALAKALQVPFTTLRASIDRWNQSVKSGWDQDFNRPMPADDRHAALLLRRRTLFHSLHLGRHCHQPQSTGA